MSVNEAPRDQNRSVFEPLLRRLVERVPGAVGAVFADLEGETIDYFSAIRPFDIKVAAAHFAVVGNAADHGLLRSELGALREIHLRGGQVEYLIQWLGDGYYVMLALRPGSLWGRAVGEIAATARDLRELAGC